MIKKLLTVLLSLCFLGMQTYAFEDEDEPIDIGQGTQKI